jgi:hypothetical protein
MQSADKKQHLQHYHKIKFFHAIKEFNYFIILFIVIQYYKSSGE